MKQRIRQDENPRQAYCHSSFYQSFMKRQLDIFCALLSLVFFGWLFIIIAICIKIKMGSPVIFKQYRPGLNEKVFTLYKFRTMTDACDRDGNILSDELRLTAFGKWLRHTSLDELPEVINILRGDMSVIGPRPQLIRDMVFMTSRQRLRHKVRPGLSGLAQINGRNSITWELKLNYDLDYIRHITFWGDVVIIYKTVLKTFIRPRDIATEGMATAEDLGDYLLRTNNISQEDYCRLQTQARQIIAAVKLNSMQ